MNTEELTGGPLAGKTVLVTGGIGKATAKGLSKMGAHLRSAAAIASAWREDAGGVSGTPNECGD